MQVGGSLASACYRLPQVIQKFDPAKFNFKKALDSEVLFQFEQLGDGEGPVTYHTDSICPASPDLVLINVSPIEYGHVLLVPRVLDEVPQLVDPQSMLLALRFCQQADNQSFRLCYNSLGAYATINHLHFQVLEVQLALRRLPVYTPWRPMPHAPAQALQKQHMHKLSSTNLCRYVPVDSYISYLAT